MPETFQENFPIIEKICRWVLEVQILSKNNIEHQKKKLTEKMTEIKMPAAVSLRMMGRIKMKAHHLKHDPIERK